MLFSFFVSESKAQTIVVTDTSAVFKNWVQRHINDHREVVNFIEKSLKKRGLPLHLRNVALIESGFDRNAVSTAGAVGVWQLMPMHAGHYGLGATERTDIYRSTQIALTSLTRLYGKYRNWLSVLAAYNAGEGTVNKAMDKMESRDYYNYYSVLPEETKEYVQRFINASYATGELKILAAKETVIFNAPSFKQPVARKQGQQKKFSKSLNSVFINSGYDLDIIAQVLEVSKKDILRWNPSVERELASSPKVTLRLPEDLAQDFAKRKKEILQLSLMK